MTTEAPAPTDVYIPKDDTSEEGLLSLLATTQMVILIGIAVVAFVLLAVVHLMHHREDRAVQQGDSDGHEPPFAAGSYDWPDDDQRS
ncbi:MAG: hypothetical protein WCD21_03260 [Streptomyces sp.]